VASKESQGGWVALSITRKPDGCKSANFTGGICDREYDPRRKCPPFVERRKTNSGRKE